MEKIFFCNDALPFQIGSWQCKTVMYASTASVLLKFLSGLGGLFSNIDLTTKHLHLSILFC